MVVEKLISSIKSKKDVTQEENNNEKVMKLTNCQEITNFYAYTRECLLNYCRITQPTKQQLEELVIEAFPFDHELKSKFNLFSKEVSSI
jgi:hypothetical protein